MSEDAQETLAREARERPRAGMAAILAGVTTLAGTLTLTVASSGAPTGTPASVLDALDARLAGRPVDSLTVRVIEFFGDRVVALVLSAVLLAVGVALTGYALAFLYRAVQARTAAVSRVGIISLVIAAVAYPVGHLVAEVLRWTSAAGFEAGPEATAEEAREAVQSGSIAVGTLLEQLGLFALAVGIVVIVLNALRAGLVTRLMGILGILAGVLALFPIDRGVIRSFWLVSLGFVFLGRAPAVQPPAWRTGRAEPWPSQQELREARERGAAREPERTRSSPAPATGAVPAGAATGQRRKRKRRR